MCLHRLALAAALAAASWAGAAIAQEEVVTVKALSDAEIVLVDAA